MHTINKTRNAKSMLRIWRYRPNNFLEKIGKDFANQVRETIYHQKISKKSTASRLALHRH